MVQVMASTTFFVEAPARWRAFVRARETSMVLIALAVGVLGGLLVAAMSAAVNVLHMASFHIHYGERLSAEPSIEPSSTKIIS